MKKFRLIGQKILTQHNIDLNKPVVAIKLTDMSVLKLSDSGSEVKALLGYKRLSDQEIAKMNRSILNGMCQKDREDKYRFFSEMTLDQNKFSAIIKHLNTSEKEGAALLPGDVLNGVSNVDIRARDRGTGFTGVIKRYGHSLKGASHGNSVTTRSVGSTGSRNPNKTRPGRSMPGRSGNKFKYVENLKVFKFDPDNNILYVVGTIPGHNGNMVNILIKESKV